VISQRGCIRDSPVGLDPYRPGAGRLDQACQAIRRPPPASGAGGVGRHWGRPPAARISPDRDAPRDVEGWRPQRSADFGSAVEALFGLGSWDETAQIPVDRLGGAYLPVIE
jgi:hypothetical protein